MPKRQKIIARVIIQMMGSPKKHIEDTLKMYIDKIKEDFKDIKILKEYQSKAKKDGKLFNVFSELDIEASGIESLVWFCFDYMPASVEIVEPSEVVYDSVEFTGFLNELQARLHKADMIIKNLSAENQIVKNNGMTLLKNIIILRLKSGPAGIEDISKSAGVPHNHILQVLNAMEKEGKIKKDKELYRL